LRLRLKLKGAITPDLKVKTYPEDTTLFFIHFPDNHLREIRGETNVLLFQ